MRHDSEPGRAEAPVQPGATQGQTSMAAALAAALLECVESAAATSAYCDVSGDLYATDQMRIRVRDCVRDYTESMRDAGRPPEQVLKSVKHILHEAMPSVESYSALATDVSRWCIEAYFEPR